MDDLASRITSFRDGSLNGYKATDKPSGMVVNVFNSLLAAAQEVHGADPVVAAVRPVGTNMAGNSVEDVGSMRAVLDQILGAMGENDFNV